MECTVCVGPIVFNHTLGVGLLVRAGRHFRSENGSNDWKFQHPVHPVSGLVATRSR